ncbi:MAG: hypothetical protein AAGD14_00070 [Planctomycetota bacterium]
MSHLIFVAGLLHFGVLIASALIPQVLDWRRDLQRVQPLTRRLVWVYGGYIVGNIVFFGIVATLLPGTLASGEPLARALCAFIAVFWTVRLTLQYRVLYARELVRGVVLTTGYHGLTLVFAFFAFVFGRAAL